MQNLDVETIAIETAKSDLLTFSQLFDPSWIPYKHHIFITDAIQECIETDYGRLIINIPQRHGKTKMAAINAPVWAMKTGRAKEVIYVTCSADLSERWSREARHLFSKVPFGSIPDKKSSAVNYWTGVDQKSGDKVCSYSAVGYNGTITGTGADLMIIDDLIKNHMDIATPERRQKLWDFYESTLSKRLQPKASIIVIMHRWHRMDFTSMLQEHGKWKVISLPLEAKENDLMGRAIGEPLWPERFGKDYISDQKKSSSTYVYSAMCQQNPVSADSGRFKQDFFKYCDIKSDRVYWGEFTGEWSRSAALSECNIFQVVDTAGTESESSDYFVCTTFCQTPTGELLVLDVYREKAETTRHNNILHSQRTKWRPSVQWVEAKGFGLNIIQQAKQDGLPVRGLDSEYGAGKSKWMRSENVVTLYEQGKVYHYPGQFLMNLENELLDFPSGEHDDIVDTMSYAGIIVTLHANTIYERYG